MSTLFNSFFYSFIYPCRSFEIIEWLPNTWASASLQEHGANIRICQISMIGPLQTMAVIEAADRHISSNRRELFAEPHIIQLPDT